MTAYSQSGDVYPVRRLGVHPPGAYGTLQASDLLKTTCIHLDNYAVPVVSIGAANGVGGIKIFTFPPGFIKRFGTRALLTFSIAADKQADFLDGTPEGDVGLGTIAPVDADALGTDATDDDWGTAAALTFDAFGIAAPVAIASEADGVHDGTVDPVELYLNLLIDAADLDDDVTTEILVSGDVWFSWLNQGGAE